jgi:hypothetical protein
MLNREASQLVFPNLGFNEPWHHVSHHGNEAEKLALLVKLNTWQIEVFGRFLDRLRKTPDGDGNLLDHSALLWGSGMSRQQQPLGLRRAVSDGRQGRGTVQRQPSPRGAQGHAARQRDADRRAEVRREIDKSASARSAVRLETQTGPPRMDTVLGGTRPHESRVPGQVPWGGFRGATQTIAADLP